MRRLQYFIQKTFRKNQLQALEQMGNLQGLAFQTQDVCEILGFCSGVIEGSVILDVALRPWVTGARRLEKTWRHFVRESKCPRFRIQNVRRPRCVEASGVNLPVTRNNIPEGRRPQTGSGFNWLSGHEPVTGYREYDNEPTAGKCKGKVHPITGHEGLEMEQRYTATLSLTLALDGVVGQRHAPAAIPPAKTRYPLYRRLGGPQGRSGRVRKISPPRGFDPGPSSRQRVVIPTAISRPTPLQIMVVIFCGK